MKTRTKSFVLVISLLLTAATNAQVTIGSNLKPSQAALLDVKTQDNATGGVTSTQGGILFPRVALAELTSLKPFIVDGGSTTDKSTNKGLIVYNLTTTSPFTEGLYMWNGAQWQRTDSKAPTYGRLYIKKNVVNSSMSYTMKDTKIPWTNTIGGSTEKTIEINEDGTYVFNVRTYARFCDLNTGAIYWFKNSNKYAGYIALVVNGVVVDGCVVFVENATANYITQGWDSGSSPSIPLVANIKKGDIVELYWNNYAGFADTANPTTKVGIGLITMGGVTDITTLNYWKL